MQTITVEQMSEFMLGDVTDSMNGRSVTVEGVEYDLSGISVKWAGCTVEHLRNLAFLFVVVREVQAKVKAASYAKRGDEKVFLGTAAVIAEIKRLELTGVFANTVATGRKAKAAETKEQLAAKYLAAGGSLEEIEALAASLRAERERRFQING